MRILIVAHELTVQRQLFAELHAAGYTTVMVARSIQETVQRLEQQPATHAELPFDVLILDTTASHADALSLCQRISQAPVMRSTPILAVVPDYDLRALESVIAAGATDILRTPISASELYARLNSMQRLKQIAELLHAGEREVRQLRQQLATATLGLQQMHGVDPVTGLATQARFTETLGREWQRAMRQQSRLSVGMIALDGSTPSGERTSDEHTLKQVTPVMAKVLKRPFDLLAYYEDNQFAMLLPETDLMGAATVAEDMRARVAALNLRRGTSADSPQVALSIGVATAIPARGSSSDIVVTQAQQAVLRAQLAGGNRVEFGSGGTGKL